MRSFPSPPQQLAPELAADLRRQAQLARSSLPANVLDANAVQVSPAHDPQRRHSTPSTVNVRPPLASASPLVVRQTSDSRSGDTMTPPADAHGRVAVACEVLTPPPPHETQRRATVTGVGRPGSLSPMVARRSVGSGHGFEAGTPPHEAAQRRSLPVTIAARPGSLSPTPMVRQSSPLQMRPTGPAQIAAPPPGQDLLASSGYHQPLLLAAGDRRQTTSAIPRHADMPMLGVAMAHGGPMMGAQRRVSAPVVLGPPPVLCAGLQETRLGDGADGRCWVPLQQ